MDKCIVVVEDCPRAESTPVSSSVGSLIKINSISIDLLSANDDTGDGEKCEHFSIRGYVSQIRKRNKKICWPFAIDGNDSKSGGKTCLLPPLDVQKFRWWRCKNCLQDIIAGCAIKDNGVASYPCRCGFKSNVTCPHVPSLDAVTLPLDFQQPPKPVFIEQGKFVTNTFTNTANTEYFPVSRSNGKEGGLEAEYDTLIGHQNGLTNTNQENATPTCIAAKVNPCITQEKCTNGTVIPSSKCNESVGVLESATVVDKELLNIASSDSDELKSHGMPLRKFRKVRLLTELLGENGVAKTDCMRKPGSCSNAVSDVSLRQGTVSILQGPVADQGVNARRGFLSQNRKRKLARDEEWKPPTMSYLNNMNMTVMSSEDAETESEEDAVDANLQIGSNCSLTEHRLEKDTTLAKRKNKKTQVIDLNISHCEIGDISEGDGTNDALLSSVQDTLTDRETDPLPFHAQIVKRKSNLCENKSKMPHVDDGPASVVPLHDATPVTGPISGKNMKVVRTEIVAVPQSTQQAPTGNMPNLSINSYLSVPRYDKLYSPQAGGEPPFSLPWHEGTNQGLRKSIETNFIGNSRVLSKSALNGVYGNGTNVCQPRKGIIYKLPFLNEKHKLSSQVEGGVSSFMQRMPLTNPSSSEKTIEDRQHVAVTKKHASRRADKISELGTVDDIPMEIVELMAKNQYERCLYDGEKEKQHPDAMNNMSAQILDFTGGHGNREFRSLQDKRKLQADHMGPTRLKFQENPSTEAQFHAPGTSRHGGPQTCSWSGDQGRLGPRSSNSTMQPSSVCNTCQTQPQHSKDAAGLWTSIIPNHTPFGFNIPQKCVAQSTNVEMLSQRLSNVQKRNMNGDHAMKLVNANAANHGQYQKNLGSDTLFKTHPDHPFACRHRTELPKRLMGSLDLYSNETIPAMHLLSLMDAGARNPSASISMEETQKLLKKPLFPQEHHSREFSAQLGVSHQYFPANQAGGASTSTSPFEQNRNFSRVTNFPGQVSLKHPQKAKTKTHEIPSQNGFHKSALASGALGKNRSEQMFLADSHPPPPHFQSHMIGNPTRKQKLDANVSTRYVWPLQRNLETDICSVNRNPADFSIPGARNGYMIRGEDLKFRKRSVHYKGQKNVKLTAAKHRMRQRIP